MFRRLLTTVLALCAMLLFISAYATTVTYTVNYAKASKYKALPLKNATLRIKLHANGTPKGILTRKTDGKQTFNLVNKYGAKFIVEVMSLQGEPKNVSCHGTARYGKTQILIDCHPRYGKKHLY